MKKHLVVLTGAGISAESGFATFRDAGGLWERYPVEKVATPEGYEADRALVLDFYNGLRRQLLTVAGLSIFRSATSLSLIYAYSYISTGTASTIHFMYSLPLPSIRGSNFFSGGTSKFLV